MRVLVSVFGLGVLALSFSPAIALGCRDIQGGRFDPDLETLATSFGRLIPARKTLNDTRQQSQTITVERLVATRIQSKDGSWRADLTLINTNVTGNNVTNISGIIDGESFSQITETDVAGLGFSGPADKTTAALKKIGQPGDAFVSPKLPKDTDLDRLSPDTPKIVTGQYSQTIKGGARSETEKYIDYTCSKNAQFAGDPTDLSTMVVLTGVIKATTVSKNTTINRSLNIKISDTTTLQTVSRKQFQTMFETLPGMKELIKTARLAAEEKPASSELATPIQTQVQTIAQGEPASTKQLPEKSVVAASKTFWSDVIEFFSLSKPGTWILLLIAVQLSTLAIIRSYKRLEKSKKPKEPKERKEPETLDTLDTLDTLGKPDKKPEDLPKEDLRKEVIDKALQEQVAALKSQAEKITGQSQELREENHKLKARLDKAETLSRDLSTQAVELQTSHALLESRLGADERSVVELEGANQRLMGINDGYREKIDEIEAEYTALMHKVMLREGALSHAENLCAEMQGVNDEINHAYTQEQTARSLLKEEFDRLSQDYNTLWSQASDRVAQFRKDTTAHKAQIREVSDEMLSLAAELETIRKDRDNLNRELHILGSENARMVSDHKKAVDGLDGKIRKLHMDLAIYRGLLEENQVQIPEMTRLPAATRSSSGAKNREAGRLEARGEIAETSDNVIPLTRGSSDQG